jgi:hypothetical protein
MTRITGRFALLTLVVLGAAACRGKPDAAKGDQVAQLAEEATKAAPSSLTPGQVVRAALETSDPKLDDNSYYDRYTYNGRRGEQITVTLESSSFDAFLLLFIQGASGAQKLTDDDDSGGGTNAQITFELPEDGTYLVLANSYGEGALGAYTIRLDRSASSASNASGPIDYAARYPGGGDPKGRYALMVGIDNYQGIGNSLRGPVADARLTGRMLVERYGFNPANVVYITDRESTREHIIEAFQRHLGQAGPDGVAVFYYSGHGMQFNANVALTGDMDPEPTGVDQALYMWSADGRGGMLLDDEIGYLASRLRTDRALIISDACFSGSGTRGGSDGQTKEQKFDDVKGGLAVPSTFLVDNSRAASLSPRYPDPAALRGDPPRHIYLGGSADDQVSWTASGWPKYGGTISVFTYYLAEEMETQAASATFSQVMQQVTNKTVEYTQNKYNTRQTPQLQGRQRTVSIAEFLAQR